MGTDVTVEVHPRVKATALLRDGGHGWRRDCFAVGKEQSSEILSAGGVAQRRAASVFIFRLLFF